MSWKDKLEQTLSASLTVAAVVMAAAVIYREFKPTPSEAAASSARSDFREHWEEILSHARASDDSSAAVRLVEFVDLECAACREFHNITLPLLRKRFGADLSIAYVHLPLRANRFAKLAAKGAECAARQNRFGEYVETTFKYQDSLGLRPWAWYAHEAGVVDSMGFASCIEEPGLPELVDSGRALANRLEISATPTVMVNGWRIANRKDEEIIQAIGAILGGKAPY